MDDSTMEHIIKENTSAMYRFAFSLTHSDDQAKEIIQRTWIKAWSHFDQLQEKDATSAWLHKICLNEFRMSLRSQKQEESFDELCESGKQFEDLKVDILHEISCKEEVIELRNQCFLAMARKLTLQQRCAFALVDMAGLSLKETAFLMDTSISAVKGLLVRARGNLQAFFEDHCSFIKDFNTCHCEAWIEFMKNRTEFQKRVKNAFSAVEYQAKGYVYNPTIQSKILAYYQQIPYQIPSYEWYAELITILKEC